ncbi:DinB family protein [Flavobacterium sp. '19STA2R22 D10 B1']|uniref:DinB family protein n=1 Tax=Flavobacterium aerium TaxID=3037261 RepID=UPI00278C4C98|nr:DinB family protein [Flavobacterium sp. '19STA2R22 D10 B1']
MNLTELYLKELNAESSATRRILGAVPSDKFDWQPHPKSMDIRTLGAHIAELPTWITMAYTTDELDFATTPYVPKPINSTPELLDFFEKSLVDGKSMLLPENEKILAEPWTLRNGETIYATFSKGDLIRHAMSQIIHHRAQMGVYLRLLDIPLPATYGSSADDVHF